MEQNGLYFCVDVLNQPGAKNSHFNVLYRSAICVHRIVSFSSFLQRRTESDKIVANLVFMLNFFRLSKSQFYARNEVALAKRDRSYAEPNTLERTHCQVCEVWGYEQETEEIWKCCSAEESTSLPVTWQSNPKCCYKSRGMEISF